MKKSIRVALLFVFPLFSLPSFAAEEKLSIVVGGQARAFSLPEMKKKLKVVTVAIDDPVYHSAKEFDGFNLTDVLELAGLDPKSANDEIVFTAKDGYAPNTSFQKLRQHQAVLTFQEHGKKLGFGKVAQGKAMISPAPYYVVWAEGKALENEVPWPYQLVKIEVVNFARKYAKLYPSSAKPDSGAMKGFVLFKDYCIRCHSVNLQGGDVGPELNSPKNVTEYWDRNTLKQFIENPLAFRYKSKMPPFAQLKGEGIDHLLEYFEAMKESKVTL